MKAWAVDLSVGIALGAVIALLVLLSSFNSTFIYRGF